MPKETSPILSIIIISYNTADITVNCLKSILQDKGLKNIPHEIILIDNASSDDSVLKIKKFFTTYRLPITNYHLLQNSSNFGFAKANNQGIKLARGNYLLLLNSDTIVLHSAISQSLDWLSSHPEAGICTAQLLNSDKTIQASGGFFPNLLNVFTWSFGLDDLPLVNQIIPPLHPHPPQFYTKDKFYLRDHPQDWVTGAFMLIRRAIIGKELFDKNYFMYGEELELTYRLKQKTSFITFYLVGPQIIHLGGASAQKKSDPIINEYLGILSFFKKHHPGQFPLVRFMLKINASLRQVFYTLRQQTQLSKFYSLACSKI